MIVGRTAGLCFGLFGATSAERKGPWRTDNPVRPTRTEASYAHASARATFRFRQAPQGSWIHAVQLIERLREVAAAREPDRPRHL